MFGFLSCVVKVGGGALSRVSALRCRVQVLLRVYIDAHACIRSVRLAPLGTPLSDTSVNACLGGVLLYFLHPF